MEEAFAVAPKCRPVPRSAHLHKLVSPAGYRTLKLGRRSKVVEALSSSKWALVPGIALALRARRQQKPKSKLTLAARGGEISGDDSKKVAGALKKLVSSSPVLEQFLKKNKKLKADFDKLRPEQETEEEIEGGVTHPVSMLYNLHQNLKTDGEIEVVSEVLGDGDRVLCLVVLTFGEDLLTCGLGLGADKKVAKYLAAKQLWSNLTSTNQPLLDIPDGEAAELKEVLRTFQVNLRDTQLLVVKPFGSTTCGGLVHGRIGKVVLNGVVGPVGTKDKVMEQLGSAFKEELTNRLGKGKSVGEMMKAAQSKSEKLKKALEIRLPDLCGEEGVELLEELLGDDETRQGRTTMLEEALRRDKTRMAGEAAAPVMSLVEEGLEDGEEEEEGARAIEPRSWEVLPPDQDYRREEVVGKLPVEKIRVELNKALENNQVVVVSGGTGSGKTTQLPQFLIDDWREGEGKGAMSRPPAVIVTQPRRIAAVSIAERVAWERNEDMGHSVGYAIRGNKTPPQAQDGTIEFVTVGTLLRRVINDPFLQRYSVVVLDEVHERDLMTDFLLVLLKEVLPRRPDLRLVMMSATLDVTTFSNYFNGCPVLEVPSGPRFPVEEIYLDSPFFQEFPDTQRLLDEEVTGRRDAESFGNSDVASRKKALVDQINETVAVNEKFDQRWRVFCDKQLGGVYEPEKHEFSELLDFFAAEGFKAYTAKKKLSDVKETVKEDEEGEEGEADEEGEEEEAAEADEETAEALATGSMPWWGSETNNSLYVKVIAGTIRKLVRQLRAEAKANPRSDDDEGPGDGAILCFLPGWGEIRKTAGLLEDCQDMWILPLHSSLPREEQQKIFESPPDGLTKVILATNIAESSVTVNDVTVVVDAGLTREMSYDPRKHMSAMDTVWACQSSCIQRKGRAGRVRDGKVYRLYSREQFESLPWRSAPEIQRVNLSRTCLQAIALRREPRGFLEAAPDPPRVSAVESAMEELISIQAVEDGDPPRMTPIGNIICQMPLDPLPARAVMIGALFGLPEQTAKMLTVASGRTPFVSPLEERAFALRKQKDFCEWSDVFAALRALCQWESLVRANGFQTANRWAHFNYIHNRRMMGLSRSSFQLMKDMQGTGLMQDDYEEIEGLNSEEFAGAIFDSNEEYGAAAMQAGDEEEWRSTLDEGPVITEEDEPLLVGLLCSAYPGNLARRKGEKTSYRTLSLGSSVLTRNSVNCPTEKGERPPDILLYSEVVVMNRAGTLRSTTALEPWQVSIFGGRSWRTGEDPTKMDLDGWQEIQSSERNLTLVQRFRKEIQEALMWQALAATQDSAARAILERTQALLRVLRDLVLQKEPAEEDVEFLRNWELPELEDPRPSEEDLNAMTKVELKALLRELGLKVSGNKPDLVQRILESFV